MNNFFCVVLMIISLSTAITFAHTTPEALEPLDWLIWYIRIYSACVLFFCWNLLGRLE